jgi:hypothetical protein
MCVVEEKHNLVKLTHDNLGAKQWQMIGSITEDKQGSLLINILNYLN